MITTNGSDSSIASPASCLPGVPVTLDSQGRVRVSQEQRKRHPEHLLTEELRGQEKREIIMLRHLRSPPLCPVNRRSV